MDRPVGDQGPESFGQKVANAIAIVVVAIGLILMAHLVFGTLTPDLPPADSGYHAYEVETAQPVEGP